MLRHSGSEKNCTTSGDVGGSLSGSGVASVVLDVSGLEPFNLKGEANNLSLRWNRWKWAFNLYVTAKCKGKLFYLLLPVWTLKKLISQ